MKRLQQVLLFLAMLVLTAGVCEVGFWGLNSLGADDTRAQLTDVDTFDADVTNERLEFFQYHPVYGFAGLPDVAKDFRGKRVTHNALGFRGPDIAPAAAPGVRRIAFIGDSQTWGWGVGDDETMPALTHDLLSEHASGSRFESLNLGASGYGVDQAYLRLVGEGFAYDPSYVVFTYFADNDISETTATAAWGVHKPYIYPKGETALCVSNVPPKRASGWPADHVGYIARTRLGLPSEMNLFGLHIDLSKTQTARFFAGRSLYASMFDTWGDRADEALAEVQAFFGCVEKEPGPIFTNDPARLNWVLRLIGHMHQATKARGAELIVVGKPLVDDYAARLRSPDYEQILSGMRRQGIRVIDMFDEGLAVAMPERELYAELGHLSAAGHKLAAQAIAEYILQHEK